MLEVEVSPPSSDSNLKNLDGAMFKNLLNTESSMSSRSSLDHLAADEFDVVGSHPVFSNACFAATSSL